MTPSSDLSRTLPLLWGAIGAGGTLAAVVLAAVRPDPPAMPELADAAFYGTALVSAALTALALWLIRGLDDGPQPDAAIRTRGVLALAAAEASAVLAGLAAFVTGNVLALAFVVPFLGVVALTWPTPDRIARWRGEA